ncbi:LOW QUALITY PROTEIN: uncharacterized protein [Amphiura filiformis]|uniref:LOW QUALITY PROTEIN: uncharacterized protein n=1 Tax=Amphiura filiformis TaxID=82378 RepID=UPI003B20DCE6
MSLPSTHDQQNHHKSHSSPHQNTTLSHASSPTSSDQSDTQYRRLPFGGGLRPPSGGLLPPSGGLHAPSAILGGGMFPPVFPGFNEARPIELEYTIKVDKIFKTDNDVKLDPKTIAKIYTAPWDGMCGVSWLVNGETYLISGSYWDDKLQISTCNWIDLYDDLTRRQKQGVKSAYKTDCFEPEDKNACQVYLFPRWLHRSRRDSCVWDAFSPYEDCESLHSRCTRNRRGKCQWQRKKEYKKCDLLREKEKTTPIGLP